MQYRTTKMQELEIGNRSYGGVEGRYRYLAKCGLSRSAIARIIGMNVYTLEKWITKWNKARREAENGND